MTGTIPAWGRVCIQVCINWAGYHSGTRPAGTRVNPPDTLHDTEHGLGRKASISREDLLTAAMRLIGPNRSVSTLSLREIAREAGIAPNSFYRQFRDMDELTVALIDLAGRSLRTIIGSARRRATSGQGVVRGSVEAFIEQLRADDKLLHVLLREGSAGSDAFKRAVERELRFFEDELRTDLVRLALADDKPLHDPALVATAITRLVFAMGAMAMDTPPERDAELVERLSGMVRMILEGSRAMARSAAAGQAPGL